MTLSKLIQNTRKLKNNCLKWQGYKNEKGYGVIRHNKKNYGAHRLVMHLSKGFDLKSPLFILHLCDNPWCVNVKHLYAGTNQQNMTDMVKRGNSTYGRRSNTAKLFNRDVKRIFSLHKNGLGIRAIADRFSVSYPTIYYILKRKAWKNVKIQPGHRPTTRSK
jgi:hypothetical protein